LSLLNLQNVMNKLHAKGWIRFGVGRFPALNVAGIGDIKKRLGGRSPSIELEGAPRDKWGPGLFGYTLGAKAIR
jgi:hypothetical protein